MKQLNNRGFSAIAGVLLIVIVAVIGGVGYYVYSQQSDSSSQEQSANTSSQSSDDVPDVKTKEDLDKASDYLDSTNVDKQVDTSALDEPLN